ncbi:S8 family serine peptidase [Gymnodinialimonas sp. 57CJ19]|uniref:S8 family serine peptidase n=1 Tax=Gymnodinialimonas sp. 57CJ19 TaxID=3138498 RepID=UPI003134270B
MTWGWGSATRMDGGGKSASVQTPASDWWLRGLIGDLPANIATPVDREVFSAHPDETAPVMQRAFCINPKADRGDVPPLDAPSGTVIMGIIDDGLAFAHARFLKPGPSGRYQTRMAAFWNQDATCGNTRPTAGYTLPFGHDWTEDEINTSLFTYPEGTLYPDQDIAYRNAEMARSVAGIAAHGTHVMDLATGYDCDDAAANDLGEVPSDLAARRPIVAVQLARHATRNSSGAFMASYVTHAIDYILDRALRLQPTGGDRLPVVLNFSYGVYASALSGRAAMEEWIDSAVKAMWKDHRIPAWVVLPAGNSHLDRTHGQQIVGNERPVEDTAAPLILRHAAGNKAPTVVEFWWPERTISLASYGLERVKGIKDGLDANQRRQVVEQLSTLPSPLRLEIKPPQGGAWITVPDGDVPFFHGHPLSDGTRTLAMVYHEAILSFGRKEMDRDAPGLSAQHKLTLILAPSVFEQALGGSEFAQSEATLPAGDWQVRLWNTASETPETVDIRCQRNDTPFGFRPFGRQSRLEDASYRVVAPDGRLEEADTQGAWVLRRGTTNAIGSGAHTIRVGSARAANLARREVESLQATAASTFSSAGDEDNDRDGVDIAAISELNHAVPGILGAGTRSGAAVRLSGTSAAAPQVARWIALELAKPGIPPLRGALIAEAENSTAVYFEDSYRPERTGARILFGPGAR